MAKHPFNSNQACSHVAVALLEALQYEPSQASAVIAHAIRRELTGADSPAARQWAEEIERNFKGCSLHRLIERRVARLPRESWLGSAPSHPSLRNAALRAALHRCRQARLSG